MYRVMAVVHQYIVTCTHSHTKIIPIRGPSELSMNIRFGHDGCYSCLNIKHNGIVHSVEKKRVFTCVDVLHFNFNLRFV